MGASTVEMLAEKWAEVACRDRWAEFWVPGGIYPRELVFFLAVCEGAGVQEIIESGRQDGVSTRMLGEYARHTGVRIHSIDLEEDEARAAVCRRNLAAYQDLNLVKGEAVASIGRLLEGGRAGPTAVLCDGPKGFRALALLCAAAAAPDVSVIGLHNLSGSTRAFFEGLSTGSCFYEERIREAGPSWEELGRQEVARMAEKRWKPRECSCLGVMAVNDESRARLGRMRDYRFGMLQPSLIRWGWRGGRNGVVPALLGAQRRWDAFWFGVRERMRRRSA